jgi:hypothetical protein
MWWGYTRTTTQSVRIIAVPPGEAPLWVREKWVGLTLPLTRFDSARLGAFPPLASSLGLGRSWLSFGHTFDVVQTVPTAFPWTRSEL